MWIMLSNKIENLFIVMSKSYVTNLCIFVHSKCVYVVTRSLQVKVVVCFLILGAGRAVNVLVPYMYKRIGQ